LEIFFYFLDKVKSREGALEEEFANNEIEKMANYTIAEQYYINAVNQGMPPPSFIIILAGYIILRRTTLWP
jgi:hypothetical protein